MQSGLLNQVPFDPLKLRNDDTREKEIKNGRLAMAAFVGFASQAAVQGKGPIECLKYHIADPFHRNSESSPPPLDAAQSEEYHIADHCNSEPSCRSPPPVSPPVMSGCYC